MTHPVGNRGPSSELEAALADVERVFAASRKHRAERANKALHTLTRYERRVVREAAVMGYVLGERAGRIAGSGIRQQMGRDEPPFPTDAAILQSVIEHCDSTHDLYPYLAAACAGRRRRVTRARLWPGERLQETS